MYRILIVEDDPDFRSLVFDVLSFEGFHPTPAENGAVALQLIQESRPDLILCDIDMPVMNGYELLAELHSQPDIAQIPVIFLSAKITAFHQVDLLNLGVRACLNKLSGLQELLSTIALIFNQDCDSPAMAPSTQGNTSSQP